MIIFKLSFAFIGLVPILSQMSIIIPHFSDTFLSLVAFSGNWLQKNYESEYSLDADNDESQLKTFRDVINDKR
jgi:hypothetical protein